MTDRIVLAGLRLRGHHGVHDFERRDGQDFMVDLVLELDTRPAATSDDVSDTVHYGEMADRVAAIVTGEPVNLIETLAERIATECLLDARVDAAEVTVHKPDAPLDHEFLDVAVRIRRERVRRTKPHIQLLGALTAVPDSRDEVDSDDDSDRGDRAAAVA